MSTSLIRRCDQCREPIAPGTPFYVLEASVTRPDGAAFKLQWPHDCCSEPCLLNATRSLCREAARAPFSPAPAIACGAD